MLTLEKTTKVLVVNTISNQHFIRSAIEKTNHHAIKVIEVSRVSSALAHLLAGDIEMIVVDNSAIFSKNFDMVREIRAYSKDIPVILIVSEENKMIARKIIGKEVQEILTKDDLKSDGLLVSIKRASNQQHKLPVAVKENIQELDSIEEVSDGKDFVTGLLSKRKFYDYIEESLNEASIHGGRVAVLSIGFQVDTELAGLAGYEVQAQFLQTAAQRLAACTRKTDLLGRVGGNELSVFLENVYLVHNVGKVAERILKVLSEPYILEKCRLEPKIHIGISIYPTDGITAKDLMENANLAMRNSREQGEDSCQFYKIDMLKEAVTA